MVYPTAPKLEFPLDKYEAPSTLWSRYLLPVFRRERNPSEAEISSHSFASLRSRFSAKGDKANGWKFKQKTTIKKVFWGIHLGEDIIKPAGTKVRSIGRGKVVYSALHPGTKEKGNWGNIIIIAHKNPKTKQVFFSLYGHLQKIRAKKGQRVELGEVIGAVGRENTIENGWWPEHLHFGIYIGPWKDKVLPGYWKQRQGRTKISYWKEPAEFVKNYKA